ncbi:MAG: sporulation transcription factor Spo0A [Ruminococcaceae bacterium]|nr:sporulation transcription factor Spo0A [Oscillospiraceae bacterium]
MVSNLSVLLTDEKDDATLKLATVLRSNKMDVRMCAKNGAELLKLYEEYHPEVIIMDAFLQHIDAMGVISRINMKDPVKRPLIIVMSGIDNPNFEREITKCGVDYYFLKPIDPQMMAERIIQISSWKGVGITAHYEAQEDLTVVITEILHQIGVPAHIKGYQYVREAIRLTVENPDMLNSVTKILYPTVAKNFKSTSSRVERAIRHAIEVAWDRGDVEVLNSYFGYTIQSQRGKPTNSEFVAMISDKIRLKRRVS